MQSSELQPVDHGRTRICVRLFFFFFGTDHISQQKPMPDFMTFGFLGLIISK